MNIKQHRPSTLEVAAVQFTIPLRYLDEPEHIADDFPGRKGDRLTMIVDLDTGKVRGWPAGRVESVYEKVCDEGAYTLLGYDGHGVVTQDDGYVPDFFPSDHYGDYVILDIDGTGKVKGWPPEPAKVQAWVDSLSDE